jgi:environmental stress-induced protein Ves
MKYTLCKKEDYRISHWTGGTTAEIRIYPNTSKYIDRNFIWRITTDNIDTEEADFSRLPDYDRVLMVVDGEVVLSHENQRVSRLQSLEQDRFDGEWKTKSFGKITDFNLIIRKGNEAYLDVVALEEIANGFEDTYDHEKTKETHAIYCKEGYCVVGFNDESQMLKEGETLILEYDENEHAKYTLMGKGTVIKAQIFYDDMAGELGPEIIPHEKATFEDFKMCIYLANVQFRWAKHLIKSLKTTWFDQELSSSIKKVEKFYLTSIVWILVAATIGVVAAMELISAKVGVISIIAWTILDCLVVSPLIYMAFMPKPIRRHIKDINSLTPYEQRVRNEELGRNEQAEKILKKYKNSGRNFGN